MEDLSSTNNSTPGPTTGLPPWLAVAGILLVCGVLSTLGIGILTTPGPVDRSVETPTVTVPVAASQSSAQITDNALGNLSAPVKIVEYADFQCPFCANFARDTEPALIEKYVKTGKVYFVFRSFGALLGPESGRAAEAAYCAGDQGSFWKYHDSLFAHQGAENSAAFADEKLTGFAGALGLDMEQFGSCLRLNKYAGRVTRDQADGKEAGVRGTPSFVINGKQLLEGAQPYDAFSSAIDAILAEQ
jgi:protein-disulfide isomerase